MEASIKTKDIDKITNRVIISIIIPVYNTEQYLEECVQSVINQTFANWELILINDGSTDKSLHICKEMQEKDNRIRLISYSNNQGVSFARNQGIENALGEYMFFLDSDDVIHYKLLEEMWRQVQIKNAEMMIVVNEHGPKYDKGNTYRYFKMDVNIEWNYISEAECMKWWFTSGIFMSHGVTGSLFAKKLLDTLYFDENTHWGEDTLFMYLSLQKNQQGLFFTISQVYYYRERDNQATQIASIKHFQSALDVYRKIRDSELLFDRRDNAILMEKYCLNMIKGWCLKKEYNINEKYIFKLAANEEKRNPLFQELSIRSRFFFFLCTYFPLTYKKLRKIKNLIY